MKKTLTGALAIAFAASAAAAQTIPTGTGPGGMVNSDNPDGFMNRGQCQSALSRAINTQRQDPTLRTGSRQDETTSEFQQNMLDRFYCGYDDNLDAWVVYTDM